MSSLSIYSIMTKKFTVKILLAILIFFMGYQSYAAWLNRIPEIITQPDGTVIHCFATGDEYYNWLHDAEGFTIIQNHTNGYYYYAILNGDQLVPSEYLAGSVDPVDHGLSPWTNIPASEMEAIRSNFMKNYMPEKPALHGYNASAKLDNEGVLNNLVVYIRFSDQTEFTEDTMQYFNMFNNTNSGYNSLQNFFKTVSYDMISIPSWFYPQPPTETVLSYQDIYPRGYFMPYDPVTNPEGYQNGESGAREHALLMRACEFIEEEVPDDLVIDKDNDGYVDNMVFIIRGATTAWSTLLWPHRWALYNEYVYINGKRVWDYNLQVEDHLNSSGAGVLCHEMFHSLSAPDLYHYNSAPYTSVGPWDLMDASSSPPQSMGAYMKYRYGGWIESIPEITECGTYTVNPLSESENNCYKIASPNSTTQYYVVEYRVKTGTFEGGLPGSGLLVYRIDMQQDGNGNAQGPPDEVYVYRPGGSTTTNGNLDQAHFAADYGRTEINDGTNPSPFLQNGTPGGLNIANVGNAGETISFDVFFEKAPVADFTASSELITAGCGVDFYDESVCEVDSWQWTFEGGSPATSDQQFPQNINWSTPGIYNVELTVSNSWGSDTETKTGYIEVSDNALPEVVFFASDTVVCTGTAVQLNDFSEVCPTNWQWEITPSTFEFINGTSSTSQNIEILLNQPGPYAVSLTATNANGSNTLNKTDYLFAGGDGLPFSEDFENGLLEDRGWTVVNPDNSITWGVYHVEGNGGERAAGIKLFDYFSVMKRDQLISPPINLTGVMNAALHFEHAYAQSLNTAYSDSLIVKISTDCGNTWTRILELAEDGSYNFATHEPTGYSFIPATPADWCNTGGAAPCYDVDITPWIGNPDTRIMFESVRMVGNNLFVDNVQVFIYTGENENTVEQDNVVVYPNPGREKFNVELPEGIGPGSFNVLNSTGQQVSAGTFSDQRKFTLDLSGKPIGIYYLQILTDGNQSVSKIILQ